MSRLSPTSPTSRIAALEHLVAKYEKSLADFGAINEELRTLPPSDRLTEIIELNQSTIASTTRLLEFARLRLERERAGTGTTPPFPINVSRLADAVSA